MPVANQYGTAFVQNKTSNTRRGALHPPLQTFSDFHFKNLEILFTLDDFGCFGGVDVMGSRFSG